MFVWDHHKWELDRNIVLQAKESSQWNLYQGMLVLDSKGKQMIHTPFADVFVGHSKVMLHVLNNRLRVLSLNGEGIKVKPKGESEEQFLVPGFQNWYGGVVNGQPDSGVATVIDFEVFAKQRAQFFMDHSYGFVKELNDVAAIVKWAAKMAALMHQELVERKMASLEDKHQEKLTRKRRKVQFNKYLRKLFLKKIQYDD